MRRLLSLALVFLILPVFALAAPASAAGFTIQDLEGNWSLYAFGVYDVKGVYYFGEFKLSQNGMIIGGPDDGAYGYSRARFTGGGLCLSPDGEIGGVVRGESSDRGSFWIAVKKGWLELNKNQITFIGSDDQEYQLLVTLVKVD